MKNHCSTSSAIQSNNSWSVISFMTSVENLWISQAFLDIYSGSPQILLLILLYNPPSLYNTTNKCKVKEKTIVKVSIKIQKENELRQWVCKFETHLSMYGLSFKTSAVHVMHYLTCKQSSYHKWSMTWFPQNNHEGIVSHWLTYGINRS